MRENDIKLNICYGCMRKLEEGQRICPSCGYDNSVLQNGAEMLPEGTVLSGKYLIGRVLGRGGFGVTYLGYDLDLQLKVAIKEYFPIGVCVRSSQSYNVITSSAMEDHSVFSKGCEAFLDEARTLAKFNSPYIVHVRDFFREHGTAYIVMDFAEGVTLKAEMKRNGGKLPYERVISLMEPLIRELGALHAENIIHRDIKPDNIMLVRDRNGEHLVLLDFGTARTYVSNETKTMTGVVTSGYSPLEQYSQKSRQGPYTDVYALCATMYHAITGVLPPASIERNVDDTPLKTFEECGIIVPKTVEQAVMHGMALKSTERTQTMEQLLEELKGGNVADINEDKTGEPPAKRPPEVKVSESRPISRPNQQGETSSAQIGATATQKSEKKLSAVRIIIAVLFAGVLLFAGLYFSFPRNTDTPATKLEATAFKAVGSIVTFGRYEQDNDTSNGKEDIEWIVLSNEGIRSFLISRYALDCQKYNTRYTSVTWETCYLRTWLNRTFLKAAFNASERDAIETTSVDNSRNQGNSSWNTSSGNNTEDKIFLLSYAEAGECFGSDSDRCCEPTAYAKAQGAGGFLSENCSWWLRSPGSHEEYVAHVSSTGSLDYTFGSFSNTDAVRPALWINLESDIF